jgi:hypothetical protein
MLSDHVESRQSPEIQLRLKDQTYELHGQTAPNHQRQKTRTSMLYMTL